MCLFSYEKMILYIEPIKNDVLKLFRIHHHLFFSGDEQRKNDVPIHPRWVNFAYFNQAGGASILIKFV